jgi:PAS domain S-box-containing protein
LQRYLGALACVALAALIRWLLDPVLGTRAVYVLQLIAVLFSARYFGFGPALLSLFLGTSPVYYTMAVRPPRNFSLTGLRFWLTMAVFYAIAAFIIWLLDRHRRMHTELGSTTQLAGERLEQLHVEVAHREREERLSAQLRAIVESSEDAILSKDLDGVIQSWNHGAEQIYGYTADEAIGKNISILVPPDRVHEEADIIERIRHGGRVKHFETMRVRKDGAQIHVSLTISPIRDPKGNIAGVSHISRDISEQKELEDQLRQTQKLDSLGVLAGGLAHDFNNLLTGVMGNASLALDELGDHHPTRTRIAEVVSASERAALLVRQMLAYAGKGRFVVEPLNLSTLISEILPLIRTSITHNVELDLRLDQNLPLIEGDQAQMQQLVMNLAINAAEAIGESHGTVTISTSAREADAERQVILAVRDTGCGMDAELRARIFDPFFTTKFTGRGLGLSAVLGIIRGHGGSISVESAPGHGSTFTVVVPAMPQVEGPGPKDPQMELRGYGHVLVVDDEELVRNMARLTLQRCGYTVDTAADGRVALELFAKRPDEFDAVLLDLTMPVLSGEDTLRGIQSIRSDVRVVLSSGYSEVEARRRFHDRGISGFLQKPYTATVLARRIKQALKRDQRVAK